jgi:hypothetical protein
MTLPTQKIVVESFRNARMQLKDPQYSFAARKRRLQGRTSQKISTRRR